MSTIERQCVLSQLPEIIALKKHYDTVITNKSTYFKVNEGIARGRVVIKGEEKVNYSTYNYLGLTADERVIKFTEEAIEKHGTSVSGSRILTGEIQLHRMLEREIADVLGVDDAVVFVGGHCTNVNLIGNLVDKHDLVLYDAFAHNSIVQGSLLSHAKRGHFAHNDMQDLENKLKRAQGQYRRVLIVAEGIYSMDGDVCDLPELIRLKKEYGAFLMIDEAHSFGTIGKNGSGITSYFGVDPRDVDILMGTLSKSVASCGGYIAGNKDFIWYLRYSSPGFIFSCGLSPSNTAAAYKAIEIFSSDSTKIDKLHDNAEYFLKSVRALGYDTGLSIGTSIVPIIIGNSQKTVEISNRLYDMGVNALPIIHPAVKENEARIRFFMSADHTREDLDKTINALRVIKEEA
ncbi:MAG: aminotransferase class I/II-fold pyridoxal phosphate-dependent enzyme [Ruminococcus sp.]|nr:aminotransferase class I/II-fold pyridoxal phosphate-dependent enzyme [Ruminococcus sp.]